MKNILFIILTVISMGSHAGAGVSVYTDGYSSSLSFTYQQQGGGYYPNREYYQPNYGGYQGSYENQEIMQRAKEDVLIYQLEHCNQYGMTSCN